MSSKKSSVSIEASLSSISLNTLNTAGNIGETSKSLFKVLGGNLSDYDKVNEIMKRFQNIRTEIISMLNDTSADKSLQRKDIESSHIHIMTLIRIFSQLPSLPVFVLREKNSISAFGDKLEGLMKDFIAGHISMSDFLHEITNIENIIDYLKDENHQKRIETIIEKIALNLHNLSVSSNVFNELTFDSPNSFHSILKKVLYDSILDLLKGTKSLNNFNKNIEKLYVVSSSEIIMSNILSIRQFWIPNIPDVNSYLNKTPETIIYDLYTKYIQGDIGFEEFSFKIEDLSNLVKNLNGDLLFIFNSISDINPDNYSNISERVKLLKADFLRHIFELFDLYISGKLEYKILESKIKKIKRFFQNNPKSKGKTAFSILNDILGEFNSKNCTEKDNISINRAYNYIINFTDGYKDYSHLISRLDNIYKIIANSTLV